MYELNGILHALDLKPTTMPHRNEENFRKGRIMKCPFHHQPAPRSAVETGVGQQNPPKTAEQKVPNPTPYFSSLSPTLELHSKVQIFKLGAFT